MGNAYVIASQPLPPKKTTVVG